ncbi:MAG: hypothetical protein IKO85_06645 [Bacteroidaceae bacterium]|nr:hypothetical protein [Bacteroidaceae bacterium]
MKKTPSFALFLTLCVALLGQSLPLRADHVDVVWPLTDMDNLSASTLTEGAAEYVTPRFTLGSNLSATALMTGSNADAGFQVVTYDPPFVQLTPKTRVTAKSTGHSVTFVITPTSGHTFKPTTIDFDAVKCGTDGGNFDVYIKNGSKAEQALATAVVSLRNKVTTGNPDGFSHHTYTLSDVLVKSGSFQVILYVYNLNGQDNENPKSIAFRNVTISGETDEPIYDASHYFSAATCSAGNLLDVIANLKNGENATWGTKLYGDPTDFAVTPAEGYTATISYNNKVCTIIAQQDGREVFSVSIRFVVSYIQPKPKAEPMNRGLLAVKTSNGVLVSWRWRTSDDPTNTRFRLYRGKNRIGSNPITERTNFLDTGGTASSVYTLEVLDAEGKVVERQEGVKTWGGQVNYITLQGGAPTDPTNAGATYTPNDASFCDMNGDGEYNIVLKWAPSNEKDAASSGTTSPAFYACYKLDGTRLWMLHTGHNMFNSAHTTPFIAWDLDGDGYGEFMVKTAPGAIDGEGNYVLLPGDDPNANLKSGRGKQDQGSEYITVFDGMTGAELKTIKYHTAYGEESTSFWGDSNQNRSERYLAAIAWLDGEEANPSAIFARGYYSGCKIGAYDWDGENLTLRWLHRGESASKGTVTYANGTVKNLTSTVYGEGAHWICVGDVTGDGRQEIHYGSGALKPDGTTLYRTGLGHGDAMHLSDFIPSRPGLEYFMVHEHKPYGMDLRDAATGEFLLRKTADGDTGRGIMAHFNPEADDAYWQSSADNGLYDTEGKVIANSVTHGGGAGLSFRIYWNGNLADDFYGKNVLESWNADGNSFGRMQVNGGNYVYGNYNNDSKQNPCVSGDLLGDWREEIVTWQQSGNDYQLVINATDYQTDYRVPHLMDDFAYRSQLINQNCAYNQPPHLSYDLISAYTIERKVPADGWDVFYTPYPVRLPEGITAYNVTGVNAATDTVRYTRLAARATIPAGASVLYHSTPGTTLRFRPSTKSAASVNTTYLRGCSVDSVLTCNEATYEYFYELRRDENGILGFFKVSDAHHQPASTPWLRVKGSATAPPLEQYYVGQTSAVGVSVPSDVSTSHPRLFDLDGRPVEPSRLKEGSVYVSKGRKVIRK